MVMRNQPICLRVRLFASSRENMSPMIPPIDTARVLRIRRSPAKAGTERIAKGADEIILNPAKIGVPRIIRSNELKIIITIVFSKNTIRIGIGRISKYSIRSLLPTVFALIIMEPTNVNTKMALNSVAPNPGFSKTIVTISFQISEKRP